MYFVFLTNLHMLFSTYLAVLQAVSQDFCTYAFRNTFWQTKFVENARFSLWDGKVFITLGKIG